MEKGVTARLKSETAPRAPSSLHLAVMLCSHPPLPLAVLVLTPLRGDGGVLLHRRDARERAGRRPKLLETSGRIRVGTRAVADLGLPLGEDLRVRNGPAGHSSLGSLCRGETEAREDSSMSAPPSRAKPYLGGRGSKMDRQQWSSVKQPDQWPHLYCRAPPGLVRAGGVVLSPFPYLFPSLLEPCAPRVEADVLMQSSRCYPAHHSNYCLPAGGPAAAPQGKGCRGFFLHRKRYGPVGTQASPGSLYRPLWFHSAGDRVVAGALWGLEAPATFSWLSSPPGTFGAIQSWLKKPPPLRGKRRGWWGNLVPRISKVQADSEPSTSLCDRGARSGPDGEGSHCKIEERDSSPQLPGPPAHSTWLSCCARIHL